MASESILALHGHLDEKSEAILRRVQEQVVSLGLEVERAPEEVRPHMTLGSWKTARIAPGSVEKAVIALSSMPAVPLVLTFQLGVGPAARISLSPVVQHDLLTWHEHVHASVGSAFGTPYRPHDFPGKWVPHISLFRCEENDLPAAYHALKSITVPLRASVAGIGFVLYEGSGIRSLASVTLRG
jgi:hypothetical protein